jgi:pimeloyl-ACP methyl ester carboxylesterase
MTRMKLLPPVAAAAVLLALLAGAATARADPGVSCAPGRSCPPAVGKLRDLRAHVPSARAAAALRARARAASAVTPETCDDFLPPQTVCGSIEVPLDRSHPQAGTLPIFFALIGHSEAGPARGTILASAGGPGISTTWDGLFPFLFEPLLDHRDLLLVDLRGTGRSGAIDCEEAQHGIGEEEDAVRACGAQLGAAASRYGSADRADDIEDVRAALGIPAFDYYGISGGGVTVQAYAVRYGNRLRTAILDAPYQPGFDDAFQSSNVAALERVTRLVCRRSPSCRAADRKPQRTLDALIDRLRAQPVSGTAFDADGQPHTLVVDETRLINMLGDESGAFLTHSEISAAARALAAGDPAPLLRIAAETDFPVFGDAGDPRFFSAGDFYATFCTDGEFPWDETARAEATRRSQYERALGSMRHNAFAPFSAPAWAESFIATGDLCVPWPAREAVEPPVPPRAKFAHVPALVLGGELDSAVAAERARAVARQFPGAQFVEIAGAGHNERHFTDCTVGLIRDFVDTAARVDARCAAQFNPTYGVHSFPRSAAGAVAPPVDPAGRNRSTRLDRQVAGMAWAAAYDGIQRVFRMFGENGVGLRGGTFSWAWPDAVLSLDYDGVGFAGDVAVSGGASVDFSTGEVDADLVVDGPAGRDGTLRVTGTLFPHTAPVAGRGTLGGRRVAVLLPTG